MRPGLTAGLLSFTRRFMHINLLHLGRVPYAEAMAIQQQVVAARKQDLIGDTLLLLEHSPVLTLGRNSHRSNVLLSDELLAQRGVEIHEVNRGGDVTYHGPGQLVGYPVLDLRGDLPGKKGPYLGPVDYVRLLEEALIRTCADFGVMAQRICKLTGVWTWPAAAFAKKRSPPSECMSRRESPRTVRTERDDGPARLRVDRPLRHHRPRRNEPRTRSQLRPPADDGVGAELHGAKLRAHLRAANAMVRIRESTACSPHPLTR